MMVFCCLGSVTPQPNWPVEEQKPNMAADVVMKNEVWKEWDSQQPNQIRSDLLLVLSSTSVSLLMVTQAC